MKAHAHSSKANQGAGLVSKWRSSICEKLEQVLNQRVQEVQFQGQLESAQACYLSNMLG